MCKEIMEQLLTMIDSIDNIIELTKIKTKNDKKRAKQVQKVLEQARELGLADSLESDDVKLGYAIEEQTKELKVLKKVKYRLQVCVNMLNGEEEIQEEVDNNIEYL